MQTKRGIQQMKRQIFSVWGSEKPFAREEDRSLQEHLMENTSGDGVDRFTDVTEPEVHFFPACGKGPRPAVLVCPGGGYHHLVWSQDGLDIAAFLNLNGFSATYLFSASSSEIFRCRLSSSAGF